MLALVPSTLGVLLSLGVNYVPFVETTEVAHPSSRWSTRSRCGVRGMNHSTQLVGCSVKVGSTSCHTQGHHAGRRSEHHVLLVYPEITDTHFSCLVLWCVGLLVRFLMSFLMVGALAVFQMVSALVQGLHPLGQWGKDVDVICMVVLLALSALLPLACGSWRASYAHPYIHTRESSADDEDDGSRPAGGGSSRRVR